MLSRSPRSLLAVPKHVRTAATAVPAKRPFVYTPRPRATPAQASAATPTPSAPASSAAAVKPKTAPAQAVGSSTVASSPASVADAPTSFEGTTLDASPESLTSGLAAPLGSPAENEIDWTTSWNGLSAAPFTSRQAEILMRPLEAHEIEIKPDGLLYLPEILYRRILNQAFGPGGWGMVPRGEMTILNKMVTREWGLLAGGRLVSVARGEQAFFDASGMPTASEGCKSNALMRCCKDLGIASELWDPSFIRAFKAKHCVEGWTEHVATKKKQKRWRKKDNKFEYPYVEAKF
ncbi:hypothetical protein JCM1840_004169 [Sporobolomyces johnsonii]